MRILSQCENHDTNLRIWDLRVRLMKYKYLENSEENVWKIRYRATFYIKQHSCLNETCEL